MRTKTTLKLAVVLASVFCLGLASPASIAIAADLPGGLTLDRVYAEIQADRLLLAELRKPVPTERKDAEIYLKRLRELATESDAVRLSLLVNKVIQQAPSYFDWAEKDFDDPEKRLMEYYVGGAGGFHAALEELKQGVLLTVINHLEVLAGIIETLSGGDSGAATAE